MSAYILGSSYAPSERTIMLHHMITIETALKCEGLLCIYNNSLQPVTLDIDSPGGNTDACYYMFRIIRDAHIPIRGIVTGEAQSGAFFILQACIKRLAYADTRFMFHAPREGRRWGSCPLSLPDLQKYYLQHLAFMSGQSMPELKLWSDEERVFSAVEACALGFIDEVIPRP